jgi:hypothetical protein
VARFDRVIPPGQEGQIVATVDTTKYRGRIGKSVKITTSDPNLRTTTLSLQADVLSWLEVLPSWTANLSTELGNAVQKTLYLRGQDKSKGLGELTALSSSPLVTPTLEKIEPGSEDAGKGDYRLKMDLSPEAPVGRISGKVTITEQGRNIDVGFTGRVNGPIAVFPAAINLIAQPAGSGRPDRLAGVITLQVRPEHPPFAIQGMAADDERLELEPMSDPEKRRHRIAVRWKSKDAKGDFRGTIRIETDNPSMPEIEVPFRVRIL